jgi:methyltransferase (TIGR00027 family)
MPSVHTPTMLSPVGRTARWVAAIRSREADVAEPLFDDPYARQMAGEDGFAMAAEGAKIMPLGQDAFISSLAIRTRYLDDHLKAAVDAGVRQLAILAAGFDARAFRLEFPAEFKLFEVDRKEIFDLKEPVLQSMEAKPNCRRTVVTVDLATDWLPALLLSGFSPKEPSVFMIEGLLIYLSVDQVDGLLDRVSSIAAPGSWIMGDVAGTELLEFEMMKPVENWLEAMGSPWVFSTLDPEGLLERHGWSPEVSTVGDPNANFGRWPYPSIPRSVPGAPRSYLFTARR